MKIPLIEDDRETAEYVANGLAEEGHVVARVATGGVGLACAMDQDFDLLIVDRMLPGIDGLKLVRSLRGVGSETPVLFLTTLGGVEDRVADFTAAAIGPAGRHRWVHAHGAVLPGGEYLVVGTDAHVRDEMRELILRAFGWSFAITLVLGFGGGVLMSGGLLRRVEAIGRTAREIMNGDTSRRLPVRGADDEFDHLAASLNALLDRTEASIETSRHVSNDIAHDLRTPLSRLRQRLELARARARSTCELRDAIDRWIGEIDLSELLRTMAEVYQPMAEERGQHFTARIATGLRVGGDHQLLAQMVANLIENAMKHSPPDATISLTASAEGDVVMLALSDTGPGIPQAERDRVFRRFYRLEASRTMPGSGLGLTLLGAVAAVHRIAVELGDNEPGLRVLLRFPRVSARPFLLSGVGRGTASPQPGPAIRGTVDADGSFRQI